MNRKVVADIVEAAAKTRDTWTLTPPRPALIKPFKLRGSEFYDLSFERPPYSNPSPSANPETSVPSQPFFSGNTGLIKPVHVIGSPESLLRVASDESPQSSAISGSSSMDRSTDSLTSRGKGRYTCPEGFSCTKGGVDGGGRMVVFERNSAFR